MKLLTLLLSLWASAPLPPAPATPSARHDEMGEDLSAQIDAVRADAGVPGLVAAAFQDGRVVAWGAGGVRVQGEADPLELSDPMHLGSCTKAMTATLIARLVEAGKLEFSTTIAEALPGLAKKIDPGFHGITVEDLLRHRAGIAERRRPEISAMHEQLEEMEGPAAEVRLEILAMVMKEPPLVPEEGQFDYSNFGYMAAGAMAEAVTGKTWEELVVEEVFRPLGMKGAGPHSPSGDGVPVGHRFEEGAFVPLDPGPGGVLPDAMSPAGLSHASLIDWGKFASDQMRGARGEEALLKTGSYEHLQTKKNGSEYAAGWGVRNYSVSWSEPVVSLNHNGSDGTWYSLIQIIPEWDLAVLVATNCGEGEAPQACETARDLLLETLGFAD